MGEENNVVTSEGKEKDSKLTFFEKCTAIFTTIVSVVVLCIIAYFLINNINWFKENAFKTTISDDINNKTISSFLEFERESGYYKTYIYHLHLSMIKESIGLFSGFGIMFIGMGFSFFTFKSVSSLKVEGKGISGGLVSASPGLFALAIGAVLIIYTLGTTFQFQKYDLLPREAYKDMYADIKEHDLLALTAGEKLEDEKVIESIDTDVDIDVDIDKM